MQLTYYRIHKSVKSFDTVDLPDFTVLTGLNGSGKTHLLEAIANGAIRTNVIEQGKENTQVRLFNYTNLTPNDSHAVTSHNILHERDTIWEEISHHIQQFWSQFEGDIIRQLHSQDVVKILGTDVKGLSRLSKEELIQRLGDENRGQRLYSTITNSTKQWSDIITAHYTNQNRDIGKLRIVRRLEAVTKLPLTLLTRPAFYQHYSLTESPTELFQQSFSRLFTAYQKIKLDNELNEYRSTKGEAVSYLSHEEFREHYGEAPWDFLNSILEVSNLDFRVNKPDDYLNVPFEAKLTHQLSGDEINFTDLSSGERVLMSFALCVYYTRDYNQIVEYPKILLFDEVDAPLHPSMTLSMLRTIQDVLVKQHGIKVILATHSPSTVALAPSDSIFTINKGDHKRVVQAPQDHALALLTTGVPTLSISTENRRQVFVESENDEKFYERIYQKLLEHLEPGISIHFIATGKEGENCEQVKDIVNRLVQRGNRTIYGIIDWDTKNQGNAHIKVLGKECRYSIENYILDPILLAAFLLREKILPKVDLGLSNEESFTDMKKFDNTRLQKAVDAVLSKARAAFTKFR